MRLYYVRHSRYSHLVVASDFGEALLLSPCAEAPASCDRTIDELDVELAETERARILRVEYTNTPITTPSRRPNENE